MNKEEIAMKRLVALLLSLLLALPCGFALAEETSGEAPVQEGPADQLNRIWDMVQESVRKAEEEITGKINGIAEELPGMLDEAKETVSSKINELQETVSGKAEELVQSLPEDVQAIFSQALEALNNGKETVKEQISKAEEAAPQVWANVLEEAQKLLDWLKGDKSGEEPEAEPENAEPETNERRRYFTDFYFGMPLSEAKALGCEPYADEENSLQVWFAQLSDPTGYAYFLFSGLDDDAALTEILCILYSEEDAVTETDDGIDIQTTEETIDAVYDSVESWYGADGCFELGDYLVYPLYEGYGVNDETVSRVMMHIVQDGEGYDADTHFVSDDGLNILHCTYLDAAELDALLTE